MTVPLAVITALMALTLLAAVGVPLILYRRLLKKQQSETSQFISRIDKHLAATVKLLEVRDYYEETSKALQKMLQEAYKEGNRFRQDQLRKLLERLEALKVRALDKQVRILEGGGSQPTKKRRRSRKPRRRDSTRSKSNARSADRPPKPPKNSK